MTPTQSDLLLDLFLQCKLATAAWLDLTPTDQRNGSTFKELETVRDTVTELEELRVPEHKIVHVLSTHLPPSVFKRHFSEVAIA